MTTTHHMATNHDTEIHIAATDRACGICGQWTANTVNGQRIHASCHTAAATPSADQVAAGCAAAQRRLRWEYTVAYRRRLRLPGVYPNPTDADHAACETLRHRTPIVLAAHLPGIQLTEWIDPHPAVIDSSWTLPGHDIDIYWDYHPNWTIGDPTALTIWHQPHLDTATASQPTPASQPGQRR